MKTLQQHINERLILNKDRVRKYEYFPKNRIELYNIIAERDYINFYEHNNDNILNLNDIDTSKINEFTYIFEDFKSTKININNWDFSSAKDLNGLFWARGDIEEIYIDEVDVSNVECFYGMFYHCRKLKTLNLNNWNIIKGNDFRHMFNSCDNLDLSFTDDWEISPEAQVEMMFHNCNYKPKWYKKFIKG
jgi:hypothetical protein